MGGDRGKGRGNFGGKCGRPIVTNGDFVAYLCKSVIELPFGVVSGVSQGMDVSDGSPHMARGRRGLWGFSPQRFKKIHLCRDRSWHL